MSEQTKETIERIRREIKESQEREEELKKIQELHHAKDVTDSSAKILQNGTKVDVEHPFKRSQSVPEATTRKFLPNLKRGIMQTFLKSRGKLSLITMKPSSTNNTIFVPPDTLEPAKIPQDGKPLRNGFVPAEQKMKAELREFQKREEELRNERRKSQPNLMALIENGDAEEVPEVQITNGHGTMGYFAASRTESRLKRTMSLADLCDTAEDELDAPGTMSLIKQFEKLTPAN